MTEIKQLQDNLVLDWKLSKEEIGALEQIKSMDDKKFVESAKDNVWHLIWALKSELSRISDSGNANSREIELLNTIISKLTLPFMSTISAEPVVPNNQPWVQSLEWVNKIDSNKKEVSLNLSEGWEMKEFKATFQKGSDESSLIVSRPLWDLTVKGNFEESDIVKINEQLNRKMLSPFSTEYLYEGGKLLSPKKVEKWEPVKESSITSKPDVSDSESKDNSKEPEFKEVEIDKTDVTIDYSTWPIAHNAKLVTNKDKWHDLVIDRAFPLWDIRVQWVPEDLLKDNKKDDLSNLVNYIVKNHSEPSLFWKSVKYEDSKNK